MAIALNRRLRKFENLLGCPEPGHASGVFFVGEELTPEDRARIDSIRRCLKCRNKRPIVFCTNVPEDDD